MKTETIAAIASGTAPAAIGVVRLSGSDALEIVGKCLHRKDLKPRYMHHRTLFDEENTPVDDVLICYFKAPASYTGEEMVEIYAHGGAVNLGRVLSAVCRAGAVPAPPGAYSKRAFLNGKIDLSRAEAIMDIIHAQNEQQCREAQKQLSGSVAASVKELRDIVMKLLCAIEASIDFSTEEELAPLPVDDIRNDSHRILDRIDRMKRAHQQYRSGGLRVALIGKPNAGKSSLFNRLLGHERAIVTNIPGTTTDTIEAGISINHHLFCFIDTAGMTQTQNVIEQLGVERSRAQIRSADLILTLIDGTTSDDAMIRELHDALGDDFSSFAENKQLIFLHTKSDLPGRLPLPDAVRTCVEQHHLPCIEISSLDGNGLQTLEKSLCDFAQSRDLACQDVALITSQRHMHLLERAADDIRRALLALDQSLPAECIAEDFHEAANALSEITGAFAAEDIVNEIFSHFCIGK